MMEFFCEKITKCYWQFLATERSLKMIKNALHFTFSRYLSVCIDILVMQKTCLIRKVNFKIYDVTTWLTHN